MAEISAFEIQTGQSMNFELAMGDVNFLLKQSDAHRGTRAQSSVWSDDVFLRSAVILSVTAWETFIEDTIRTVSIRRIENASTPEEVRSAFLATAKAWWDTNKVQSKPASLMDWAGTGWKALLKHQLEKDLQSLNTPDSLHVEKLSEKYLGCDVTSSWHWPGTGAGPARRRLNELIKLRGSLAHRSAEIFAKATVKKINVVSALKLLPRLVQCTEDALGQSDRARRASQAPPHD